MPPHDAELTNEEVERILEGEGPIRIWREKRGYALVILAMAVDISEEELLNYEAELKQPDLELLEQLAVALRVTPADLLAPDDDSSFIAIGPVSVATSGPSAGEDQ